METATRRHVDGLAARLVRRFRSTRPLRTGSLLITVFGDVVHPRGGRVWLSDLIALMHHLGVGERLVRTSLSRLAQDDWFEIEQVGRRSVYGLAPRGRQRIREASPRIYGDPRRDWGGRWQIALLADVAPERRDAVRRELERSGFRALSANAWLRPQAASAAGGGAGVAASLDALEAGEGVLLLSDATPSEAGAASLRAMSDRLWDKSSLSDGYRDLINSFRDVVDVSASGFEPLDALVVRIMLIHDYRRLVLKDPGLPAALLGHDWPGFAAFQLVRNAYRQLREPAETAVDGLLATPLGPLPPPSEEGRLRFAV